MANKKREGVYRSHGEDRVSGLRRAFTDFAAEWALAWGEGRREAIREFAQERDGPVQIRCEFCGQKYWLDIFTDAVVPVEQGRN